MNFMFFKLSIWLNFVNCKVNFNFLNRGKDCENFNDFNSMWFWY